MPTALRQLYGEVQAERTAQRAKRCLDLHNYDTAKQGLAASFLDSLRMNQESFTNVEQPFLDANALSGRAQIGPHSRGTNRVVWLLKNAGESRVHNQERLPKGYAFKYVEREVPPLRTANAGAPNSGRGGIDYLALRLSPDGGVPVLGEVKVRNDTDAFYAFIQLITYLSEMATQAQIERANRHKAFGVSIGSRPVFDLHILLADFNDRGEKGQMIDSTRRLAEHFIAEIRKRDDAFPVIGKILCLKMNTIAFGQPESNALTLHWIVEGP